MTTGSRHVPPTSEPDLLVVGGGAGGLSAARAAVRAGATAVLVQEGPLGGDCTFTGCVPSKAVIEAAARGEGFASALAGARRAVARIAAAEDDAVLAGEGVEVVHGRARFTGPRRVEVELEGGGGAAFRPRQVVIATGATPALPPVDGLADARPLTNETVFDLEEAPRSMAVLGGGAIGCELAQAFARLGVGVTLLEALDRLLSREEPEASSVVEAALRRAGVDVRTATAVERVERAAGGVCLHLAGGATVDAERLLVATGRQPATAGLGLEAAGVATERDAVVVDDTLATSAEGVWAVGDVTGLVNLTHAADEMGRLVVANALGPRSRLAPLGPLGRLARRRFDADQVPGVTFTAPEVASVGRREAQAGPGARVAHLPLDEVDRAVVAGATEGFVKLVVEPRRLVGDAGGGRVVGATIVAERAGEMIAEVVLALRTGMFAGRLAQTVHAYPTWTTAVRQAAAQLFGEVGGRTARPARRG